MCMFKVPIDQLWCSSPQKTEIGALYTSDLEFRATYQDMLSSQALAAKFLQEHQLDLQAHAQLDSQWMVIWSHKWGSGSKLTCRILVQWYHCYHT